MKVTFIGHSEIKTNEQLKIKLKETLENCIGDGAGIFYCGGYGQFDGLCAATIKELKEKYPIIKSYLVTPYINEFTQKKLSYIQKLKIYDDFIYPELETVPLKFAISKRNQWMVDQADVVIAYVDHDWGGAWTTLEYAKRKKMTIINLEE
jgi:uncharacterized phage-like protein YoqJ